MLGDPAKLRNAPMTIRFTQKEEEENRKLVLETIARRVQGKGKRLAKGSVKPFRRKP